MGDDEAWATLLRARHDATVLPLVDRPGDRHGDGSGGNGAGGSLLPLFAPLLARETVVLGRLAQTLDGRIATARGVSQWIGGPEDVLHTHRLRALFDAVVVGAGTVAVDDPQLTTRRCAGPHPVRVVLDPDGRLGRDYQVFRDGPPTLVARAEELCGGLRHHGAAEILPLPRDGFLAALVPALRARGLRRIFVEGGGVTVSRFLAAGLLDRLHLTVAPVILGSGRPSFLLPEAGCIADGLRLRWTVYRLGEDMLLDMPIDGARPGAPAGETAEGGPAKAGAAQVGRGAVVSSGAEPPGAAPPGSEPPGRELPETGRIGVPARSPGPVPA